MDVDIGKSELLYTGSSILTAIAVIIFTTGDSTLSPVTKIGIMGLLSAFFLVFGTYVPKRLETMLLYGLAAFTYIAGALYTVSRFDIGSDGSFLILAASAAVFAGIGHLITQRTEEGFALPKNKFMIGAAIILLLGLSLTLFDMNGADVNYSTNLNEEVNLTGSEPVQIGTVVVQNNFILPQNVDLPRYRGCVYTPERREAMINVENEYSLDLISGGDVEELDLTLRTPNRHDEEPEELGTLPVERANECPNTAEQNKIIVVSGDSLR